MLPCLTLRLSLLFFYAGEMQQVSKLCNRIDHKLRAVNKNVTLFANSAQKTDERVDEVLSAVTILAANTAKLTRKEMNVFPLNNMEALETYMANDPDLLAMSYR